MKMTVLQCVQHVLNKMNSDEVNSIWDTVESTQVAYELQSTFYHMIGNIDRPNEFGFVELEASGDPAKPNYMRIADDVDHFEWIKYRDTSIADQEQYKEITYLSPSNFVEHMTQYTPTDDTQEVTIDGAVLNVPNNKHPQYFTTFDDEYLVFDSFDNTVDDTLQVSKMIAWGKTIPSLELSDNEYPELPAKYFPQLLAETTMACMWYWKQQQDPIDAQRARQQYVRHFNNRNRADAAKTQVFDFGRR